MISRITNRIVDRLPPVGRYDLDATRIVFYGSVLLLFWDFQFRYYAFVPKEMFFPSTFFDFLSLPAPGQWIETISILWKISIFTTCIGLATRTSAVVCFTLGFYLLGLDWTFGNMHHRFHTTVVCMGIFALAQMGRTLSCDSVLLRYFLRRKNNPGVEAQVAEDDYEIWPLRFCQICWCMVYFGAGLAKLRATGLDFVFSDVMRNHLLHTGRAFSYLGNSLQETLRGFVLNQPIIYKSVAAVGLLTELASPLALVLRKWRWIPLMAVVGMHIGIFLLMYIRFTEIFPIFVVWVPWTRLYEWAALRNRPA